MFFLNVSFYRLQHLAAQLRAIYDKHGDYGLKEGVVTNGQRIGGGYFLRVSPESIFDKIFNAADPWADQPNLDGSDFRGSMFGDGYRGTNHPKAPAPSDVVVELVCTLEEFYQGSLKSVGYSIDQVKHDGRTTVKVSKEKTVQVDAGFSEQTQLTFKGQGNQCPNQQPSNLVVKFVQKEHSQYRRAGDDLIYTVKIDFVEALQLKPIYLRTLDGRKLTACFDEVVSP